MYNKHTQYFCGSSSVVEHFLAKEGVAGSSPVFRSIKKSTSMVLFYCNISRTRTRRLYADKLLGWSKLPPFRSIKKSTSMVLFYYNISGTRTRRLYADKLLGWSKLPPPTGLKQLLWLCFGLSGSSSHFLYRIFFVR